MEVVGSPSTDPTVSSSYPPPGTSLLPPAGVFGDVAIGPPPSKRSRPNPLPDDRIICQPVAFTNIPSKPRMYMLPLRKKVPQQAAPLSSSSSTSASAGAGSGAASSTAVALPPPEVPVIIPLVRPPTLQNLDDYLTLIGNMYYSAPETGKSNAQVSHWGFGMERGRLECLRKDLDAFFYRLLFPPAVCFAAQNDIGSAY